ncbi:hypothetical protein A3K63_05245 [Candidatus Micrarchaeota archaeon RBG_16_49_10]|nr:MAG: hypothetical protein A3K63_05245 [Candidatus Micrarchaeota archaeon RBG_16_49_10]
MKAATRTTPTLLVTGSRDEYMTPDGSRRLKEIGAVTDVKIIDGADHACSNPQHQRELVDYSVEWFRRWLTGITSRKI